MKSIIYFIIFICVPALSNSLIPKSVASIESTNSTYVFEDKNKHQVLLLNKGSSSFAKRIELIRNAKKSIVLEYFIYNHDTIGKFITHELIKKAKEGVRVRILVDNFMVGQELTPHHSAELLRRGIEIKYYSPIPLISVVKTQYRNHRKLFLIDDKEFIVGGRNIGDDYFDLSERYNFVDRDALFTGPSALKARKSFDAFFNSKNSEKIFRPQMPSINQLVFLRSGQSQKARILQEVRSRLRTWKEERAKGKDFLRLSRHEKNQVQELMTIGNKALKLEQASLCEHVEFVSDQPLIGPSNDSKRITRNYIYKYLSEAKSKITIDSPYFILNDELFNIIENQLDNNLEISLLTNGIYSSDALAVAAVFNHYLKSWIEKGLKPSVYSGKRLFAEDNYVSEVVANSRWGTHSKTLSIDGSLSVIGSYNFDPRSAVYSMELMVACHDNSELASAIETNIKLRESNSINFKSIDDAKKHEFHNISMFKKMGYYLIKPLSLLLQSLL
jgi:cardiolipin synthase C